jgi:hypothetical protein
MSTSYSTVTINPLAGQGVSEKLTKTNFTLWRMQVLATVRGARLEGFLTGAIKAPTTMITEKRMATKWRSPIPPMKSGLLWINRS